MPPAILPVRAASERPRARLRGAVTAQETRVPPIHTCPESTRLDPPTPLSARRHTATFARLDQETRSNTSSTEHPRVLDTLARALPSARSRVPSLTRDAAFDSSMTTNFSDESSPLLDVHRGRAWRRRLVADVRVRDQLPRARGGLGGRRDASSASCASRPLPLGNGEAYYYSWSRFLDWSYYDHPPLVAWMVRAHDRVRLARPRRCASVRCSRPARSASCSTGSPSGSSARARRSSRSSSSRRSRSSSPRASS